MGIGCLRRPTRVRFYAIFSWICLRAHSLSNIFVWLRTLLQSCSWSNDRIKNNEEEEGHVLIHWLLHGESTLGNYLFRQKCIEHVERAVFFPVRRWLKRRGGRGTWRRRKRRRRRSKRRRNDSAGRRRWFCRCFLAAGKQHIMLQGHVWGNPWSWEFSPTRCLLFASAVPTRGSSFIFGFWLCKLRGLRLCRKGNKIVPWAVVSQQNSCYLLITCVFWTAEISHAASSYTH